MAGLQQFHIQRQKPSNEHLLGLTSKNIAGTVDGRHPAAVEVGSFPIIYIPGGFFHQQEYRRIFEHQAIFTLFLSNKSYESLGGACPRDTQGILTSTTRLKKRHDIFLIELS